MSDRPDVPELIPARMLNELAYCPRLAYLEWVQGDFADSADTVDGRHQHRRVDKEGGDLPPADQLSAEGEGGRLHARSVYLSAPQARLVARIDLVEAEGGAVRPIDYKRGEAPDVPEGAWEPERVQVCAQGMVLAENGYACSEGIIYFVASRKRVVIPFTDDLRARTTALLAEMRRTMASDQIPPPLSDSPKCPRCSLCGICLPDETNLLRLGAEQGEEGAAEPRRLLAARDDALPLYVHSGGTRVGKSGDEFVVVPREGPKQTARIGQTSQVSLFGQVQISTQAVEAALGRGIPVCYFSSGGWFYGMTAGLWHKNMKPSLKVAAAVASTHLSAAIKRRPHRSHPRPKRHVGQLDTFRRNQAAAASKAGPISIAPPDGGLSAGTERRLL
jgi:CRISP-associated protein Cas1